jgi:hypothetical protein
MAVLVAAAGVTACQSHSDTAPGRSAPDSGAPGRVISTIRTEADLKYPFATVSELTRSSVTTSIVVGTVRSVGYQYADGLTQTRVSVDVTRTLKGTTRGRIVVNEDGGYVDARTIQAENQAKFPDSPITARQGDVVDERFEVTEHPVIGHKLMFLQDDPNKGHAGEYQGVMSALSRFTLDGGTYKRSASDAGLQADTTLDAVIADLH